MAQSALKSLFRNLLKYCSQVNSVTVYGDFNIPNNSWKDYSSRIPDKQQFIDLFVDNNLNQTKHFPIAAAGILDLIVVNNELGVTSCKLSDDQINTLSNYLSSLTAIKIQDFKSLCFRPGKPTAILSYCKGNFNSSNAIFEEKPFSGLCWSNVYVPIEQLCSWTKLFVFRKVPCMKKRRSHSTPWVNPSFLNLIKLPEMTKRNQPINRTKIRFLQKSREENLERDRANFETKLSHKRSTSQLFKDFRSFHSTRIPNSIVYRTEIATDSRSRSDLFCNFFGSIFTVSTDFISLEECIHEKLLVDFNVSKEQLQHICESLDNKKATGPDELPSISFKRCAKTINKSLAKLFHKIEQTVVIATC